MIFSLESLIINYKFNGKNSENQTVQINKNARPHMPEGKIIEKVRAWAVLVRRPEDSSHKRFLSSYFAFQHFSHLSHFEKNRIYCISAECEKIASRSHLTKFFSRIAFAFDFQNFFAFASLSIFKSAQSASSGELAELASSASSAQRNSETSQLS